MSRLRILCYLQARSVCLLFKTFSSRNDILPAARAACFVGQRDADDVKPMGRETDKQDRLQSVVVMDMLVPHCNCNQSYLSGSAKPEDGTGCHVQYTMYGICMYVVRRTYVVHRHSRMQLRHMRPLRARFHKADPFLPFCRFPSSTFEATRHRRYVDA